MTSAEKSTASCIGPLLGAETPGRDHSHVHDPASWRLRQTFDGRASWVSGHGRGIAVHGFCAGPFRTKIVYLHEPSGGATFSFRIQASKEGDASAPSDRRAEAARPGPQADYARVDDALDLSWALPSGEADLEQTRSDLLIAVIVGLHRLMSAGRFADIDRVLRGQSPSTMSPDLMQAYVRTTASVRSKLTHWTTSVHQMHAEVASRGLMADRIFVGLL